MKITKPQKTEQEVYKRDFDVFDVKLFTYENFNHSDEFKDWVSYKFLFLTIVYIIKDKALLGFEWIKYDHRNNENSIIKDSINIHIHLLFNEFQFIFNDDKTFKFVYSLFFHGHSWYNLRRNKKKL